MADCPDCRDLNGFCKEHQHYEAELYENSTLPHDSHKFRKKLHVARMNDFLYDKNGMRRK